MHMTYFYFQAKELSQIANENSNVHILTLDVKNFDQFDAFAKQVTNSRTFFWSPSPYLFLFRVVLCPASYLLPIQQQSLCS